MKKRYLALVLFISVFAAGRCFAGQQVTLLYTGQTHSALYPCQCPVEADGGLARRAAKIKEIRKADPDAILVDSGSFFAGGAMDENSQNTELDKERTLITLKGLKAMRYDALGIGDDEFNFTAGFLSGQMDKAGAPFLSCNVKGIKAEPFIIKEVKGVKLGIVAVTSPIARAKAAGLEMAPADTSVKSTVESLKKSGVDIVVLLSSLSSDENTALISKVDGIDIVIGNFLSAGQDLYFKKGSTLIFKPVFEGRRLGKAILFIENKKIKEVDLEEIRLSSEIKDDRDMFSMLPRCFSDSECKKDNLVGFCQNAGTSGAVCTYAEADPISFSVVEPAECKGCNTKNLVAALRKKFPGLKVNFVQYPSAQSKRLIEEFRIETLPAYILGKEADQDKEFESMRNSVDARASGYLFKPLLSGVALYLNREKIDGKFDLFISLFDKDAGKLLEIAKEFAPQVHFLAMDSIRGFEAKGGIAEVEEYKRCVCVQKYYPKLFWDYMICRSGRSASTWWEDCLPPNIDNGLIAKCARSNEGSNLLDKNIALNKELQLLFGPAYLVNNQEIYGGKGVPSRPELKAIIKK